MALMYVVLTLLLLAPASLVNLLLIIGVIIGFAAEIDTWATNRAKERRQWEKEHGRSWKTGEPLVKKEPI